MKLPSIFNIAMLAFVISVFSLSFLSVGLQLNSSSQVLGETVSKTTSIVAQRPQVPCSELNVLNNQLTLLQRKYCSSTPSIYPLPPTPTVTPAYPTSVLCKVGVNSFGVNKACSGGYLSAFYSCYDGFSGELGNGTTCQQSDLWRVMAEKACAGRSSCTRPSATPTPVLPCRTGLKLFQPSTNTAICNGGYSSARFACVDDFNGMVGDPSKCYTYEVLKDMATEKCLGHKICSTVTSVPIMPIYSDPAFPTKSPVEAPIYIEPQPPRD